MSFISRWAKPKYKDEQLVARAETALAEDPVITKVTALSVSSQKGVVSIIGTAVNDREKNHIEGTVRSALKQAGLKFERIENRLAVNR